MNRREMAEAAARRALLRCAFCDAPIPNAKRSTAKYCSDRCRFTVKNASVNARAEARVRLSPEVRDALWRMAAAAGSDPHEYAAAVLTAHVRDQAG
jgi:hypothetical protein